MASLPWVPLTVTVSAAPSPPPPVAPRSIATWVTPVPVRSLTVMLSVPPTALSWIFSTLLRSITMAPTSRASRTRPPLAEISIFSLALEPLNTSVSVPAPPSTISLPSPGFQTKVSLPSPRSAKSLPWPPITISLPVPPIRVSAPWLPVMVSLPAPPSMTSLMVAAGKVWALMTSLPAPALIVSTSLAPSAPMILTCAANPRTETEAPAPIT